MRNHNTEPPVFYVPGQQAPIIIGFPPPDQRKPPRLGEPPIAASPLRPAPIAPRIVIDTTAWDRKERRKERLRRYLGGAAWVLVVTALSVTGIGGAVITNTQQSIASITRGVDVRVYEGETFTGSDNWGNSFTFTLVEGGELTFALYNDTPATGDRWAVKDGRLQLTIAGVPTDSTPADEVVYTSATSKASYNLHLVGIDTLGRQHELTATLAQ